ncbi:transposase, partial [Rhodocytophaga aerolata]|uniref:transposase n=1 Tax=Rhodocytophaga aerolata TaxID=455078 RepID=UPI00361A0AFD
VDTYHHIITHIQADYADERDSVHLLAIVDKIATHFKQHNLLLKNILADGGFGSGLNYALLESCGYTAYIPLQGSYHPVREGFSYDARKDVYLCRQGKELSNQGIRLEKGFANATYLAKQGECTACPLKKVCCQNRGRKKLVVTAYHNHYQRMQQRLESRRGKYMKWRRMATVEPVFGSLLNYFGMWRANARGKQSAHKMMLMAAVAYNLQKLLRGLTHPKAKSQIMHLQQVNILYFLFFFVVPQPRRFLCN